MVEAMIIATQTRPLPRAETQCRKQAELRNAIQTQTAFQNLTIQISQWSIINDLNTITCFLPGPNYDSDKKRSAEITQQLQRDFKDVFNGIGCFGGTFSLQLKPDSKPYQAPLRCMAYVLQNFQGGTEMATGTRHHNTSRCWDSWMVQQALC